jgi:hypothetical protein
MLAAGGFPKDRYSTPQSRARIPISRLEATSKFFLSRRSSGSSGLTPKLDSILGKRVFFDIIEIHPVLI